MTVGALSPPPLAFLTIRASLDTKQRLPYTPHRTTPKKPVVPNSPPLTITTSTTTISVSDLLSRNKQSYEQGTLAFSQTFYQTPYSFTVS